MPHVLNPKSGYISGCNQQTVPLNYKHLVGIGGFGSTGRSHRARELLDDIVNNKKKVDLEFMKEMQLDVHDSYARELLKLLIPLLDQYALNYYSKGSQEHLTLEHMIKIMKDWNFENTADSKGALVFNLWFSEIMEGFLKEQLLDSWIRKSVITTSTVYQFIGRFAKKWLKGNDLDHIYCVNEETRKVKNPCTYNLVNAVLRAHKDIITRFGSNEDNWRWGYYNVMRSQSDTFSSTFLRFIFERDFLSPVLIKFKI